MSFRTHYVCVSCIIRKRIKRIVSLLHINADGQALHRFLLLFRQQNVIQRYRPNRSVTCRFLVFRRHVKSRTRTEKQCRKAVTEKRQKKKKWIALLHVHGRRLTRYSFEPISTEQCCTRSFATEKRSLRRYLFVRLYAISAVRATEEETIALIDTYRKWLAFLELETQVT